MKLVSLTYGLIFSCYHIIQCVVFKRVDLLVFR